jgi:hypothetical protein
MNGGILWGQFGEVATAKRWVKYAAGVWQKDAIDGSVKSMFAMQVSHVLGQETGEGQHWSHTLTLHYTFHQPIDWPFIKFETFRQPMKWCADSQHMGLSEDKAPYFWVVWPAA